MSSPAKPTALDIGATNAILGLSAGRCEVTKFFFTNLAGVTAYLQVWDQTPGTITWGSTAPIQPFAVPNNTTVIVDLTSHPWLFSTQCSVAVSTHPIFTGAIGTGVLINALIN